MQTKITLGAIQTVLVGFANFDYACHALTPRRLEGWRMFRIAVNNFHDTKLLFEQPDFTPHLYSTRPNGQGFTALFDNGGYVA